MGLLDNDQRGLLKQAEMRPTPRNALLGLLADVLESGKGFANRAQIPASVPLVGGQGVGSLLLGQAPEELSEWSYGNAPMRINPLAGRTASYVPEMKRGRGQGVADLFAAAQVPGGKNALLAGMGAIDNSAFNKAGTVWHGSPHKFDKFDSSKIGTGEGAQAYGHGLYLADSADVAKQYQDALKGLWTVDGAPRVQLGAAEKAIAEAGSKSAALAKQDAWVKRVASFDPGSVIHAQKLRDEIARTVERAYEGGGANLYKVDLPDEKIARMLDWDAPLSQQGEAMAVAQRLMADRGGSARYWADKLGDRPDGQKLWRELNNGGGAVEQELRRAGIPGIRYLDGGSRGAGQGTRNYVVFPGEENALTILERNGQRLR